MVYSNLMDTTTTITNVDADHAVRLDANKHYAIITCQWEYSQETLLVETKGARTYTSWEDLVRQYTPRDEALTIIDVMHV